MKATHSVPDTRPGTLEHRADAVSQVRALAELHTFVLYVMAFLYAFFMPSAAKPSRGFTGVRLILTADQFVGMRPMLDLVFVVLGAALFLGALVYARGCAGI